MSSTFVDFGCNVFQVNNFSAFHFLNDRSSDSKSSELLHDKYTTPLAPLNCMDSVEQENSNQAYT